MSKIEIKEKSVAILYDSNGNCISVLNCTHVNSKKYDELLSQVKNYEFKKAQKEKELLSKVNYLETEIETLKHEIKVLKGEE